MFEWGERELNNYRRQSVAVLGGHEKAEGSVRSP